MSSKKSQIPTMTLCATMFLALLLSLTLGVQMVSANPVFAPPIKVNSPENNKIYPSNQVALNFTVINAYHNYMSFSYSLDGKDPIDTNQSCVLTNLPSGSHTLIIYGNSTEDTYWGGHELLGIVYFSTTYSTAWLTFGLILGASIVVLSLLIFFGRRRIATRLKNAKKFSFWLGLVGFLFFTCFVFIPSFWHWANEYLFPQFPIEHEVSPVFGFIFSVPFMVLGLFLMWVGTRKGKSRFDAKANQVLGS